MHVNTDQASTRHDPTSPRRGGRAATLLMATMILAACSDGDTTGTPDIATSAPGTPTSGATETRGPPSTDSDETTPTTGTVAQTNTSDAVTGGNTESGDTEDGSSSDTEGFDFCELLLGTGLPDEDQRAFIEFAAAPDWALDGAVSWALTIDGCLLGEETFETKGPGSLSIGAGFLPGDRVFGLSIDGVALPDEPMPSTPGQVFLFGVGWIDDPPTLHRAVFDRTDVPTDSWRIALMNMSEDMVEVFRVVDPNVEPRTYEPLGIIAHGETLSQDVLATSEDGVVLRIESAGSVILEDNPAHFLGCGAGDWPTGDQVLVISVGQFPPDKNFPEEEAPYFAGGSYYEFESCL